MKIASFFNKIAVAAFVVGSVALASCTNDEGEGKKNGDAPTLDIEADKESAPAIPESEKFKIISYNTWEGFNVHKSDKFPERSGNLQPYIDWVTAQNPDVVAYQEMWKWNDYTNSKYDLATLAKAYGHNYVVINANTSGDWSHSNTNYHVAITSKHPFELTPVIMKDKLSHGAIYTKVKGVNIVVMHTWPNYNAPNTIEGDTNQLPPAAYSETAISGEAYRTEEVDRVMEQTIRQYPDEPLWVFCGDFNSCSRLDKDAYVGVKGVLYDVHDRILASGYYDSLREFHNYYINTQTAEEFRMIVNKVETNKLANPLRIDFMYVSKSLLSKVTRADVIKDDFTRDTKNASDHYPCVLEFDNPKTTEN